MYCFSMNTNIQGDSQTCISATLRISLDNFQHYVEKVETQTNNGYLIKKCIYGQCFTYGKTGLRICTNKMCEKHRRKSGALSKDAGH